MKVYALTTARFYSPQALLYAASEPDAQRQVIALIRFHTFYVQFIPGVVNSLGGQANGENRARKLYSRG